MTPARAEPTGRRGVEAGMTEMEEAGVSVG